MFSDTTKPLRRMQELCVGSSDLIPCPQQSPKTEFRVPSTVAVLALQTKAWMSSKKSVPLERLILFLNDSFESQEAKWKTALCAWE